MDDAAARTKIGTDVGRLEALAAGMPIPFGGDRVAYVSDKLAGAFAPGDRLVVVQETGDLLHVPAAVQAIAAGAVGRAHEAFGQLARVGDEAITAFFAAFADNLADDGAWSAIAKANELFDGKGGGSPKFAQGGGTAAKGWQEKARQLVEFIKQ